MNQTPLGPLRSTLERTTPNSGSSRLRSNNLQEAYLQLLSVWSEPHALVLGMPAPAAPPSARLSLESFTREMMYSDATQYLPDDILTKVDRATMSVALEARVPFL